MNKSAGPRQLSLDLLPRSICTVKVGCVVTDAGGAIIGWGWNSLGPTGYGLCAERHAFSRVNKNRMWSGFVYVAAEWASHGRFAPAKPCEKCQAIIEKYEMDVYWRDKGGKWRHEINLSKET